MVQLEKRVRTIRGFISVRNHFRGT
jgi:hypothetical protein